MKKLFVLILTLFYFGAKAQLCETFDTVRNNTVTLVTSNSARINGTISHIAPSQIVSLQLKYVRVGFTDTVTNSSLTTLRNLTGLSASTTYWYYYKTICPSGSVSQNIAYQFTTLTSSIIYADERPTKFHYMWADSGLAVPSVDTSLYRSSAKPSIVYKSSDNNYYAYHTDCSCWRPLSIDSAGIIDLLNQKVDSVTVNGDSLFYWIQGVSYGYILPVAGWALIGNTGTDTATNWIGTNDNMPVKIRVNGTDRMIINTAGALSLSGDYGTSGYVLKTVGNSGPPVWVSPGSIAPTWQQTLTAGSTLTMDNTINISGYDLLFDNSNNFQSYATNSIEFLTGSTISSQLNILKDTIKINPYLGRLIIDTLLNNTAQNTFIGWRQGAGQGDVGYITATSPLSISSGALSLGTVPIANGGTNNTATPTNTYIAVGDGTKYVPTDPASIITVTPTSTNTLTNKRWTARVGSTTSSATPTINTDNVDIYKLTAQTADITSFTTNLSGTPVDGDILEIQVTGTAARAITWGASFVASTVTLPTTTVTTATLTTIFQYYTTSSYGNNKWVCVNSY